jgi:hypothetical protein
MQLVDTDETIIIHIGYIHMNASNEKARVQIK